jgi:hypothetical protein
MRAPVPRLLETDLARPAEAFFRDQLGVQWDFAHEIELRKAGPDIVAGRRSPAFVSRLAAGPAPATDELTLRLIQRLANGATDEELRAWAPWGWPDLRRRAFAPAVARGIVGFDGSRWWAPPIAPPYDEIIAIELKLRDWRKGLRQARRNQAFAWESWLALARIADDAVALAHQLGVGLVQVGDDGDVELVAAARRAAPVAALETRLAAEQVFEQALEKLSPGCEKFRPLAGSPRGRKLAVSV